MKKQLRLHSTFASISGEGGAIPQGTWTRFIRFQGCNLECSWCDTKSAQCSNTGTLVDIQEVLEQCKEKHVIITGGEPLEQKEALVTLVCALLHRGHLIQIETNGSKEILSIPSVAWVIDYKMPSSGMMPKMLPIRTLVKESRAANSEIYIKWVVADDEDMHEALRGIRQAVLMRVPPNILLSPLDGNGGRIPALVDMIRENDPELLGRITFSIQLHKIFNLP